MKVYGMLLQHCNWIWFFVNQGKFIHQQIPIIDWCTDNCRIHLITYSTTELHELGTDCYLHMYSISVSSLSNSSTSLMWTLIKHIVDLWKSCVREINDVVLPWNKSHHEALQTLLRNYADKFIMSPWGVKFLTRFQYKTARQYVWLQSQWISLTQMAA